MYDILRCCYSHAGNMGTHIKTSIICFCIFLMYFCNMNYFISLWMEVLSKPIKFLAMSCDEVIWSCFLEAAKRCNCVVFLKLNILCKVLFWNMRTRAKNKQKWLAKYYRLCFYYWFLHAIAYLLSIVIKYMTDQTTCRNFRICNAWLMQTNK